MCHDSLLKPAYVIDMNSQLPLGKEVSNGLRLGVAKELAIFSILFIVTSFLVMTVGCLTQKKVTF